MKLDDCVLEASKIAMRSPIHNKPEPEWLDAKKKQVIPEHVYRFYCFANYFSIDKAPKFLNDPKRILFSFLHSMLRALRDAFVEAHRLKDQLFIDSELIYTPTKKEKGEKWDPEAGRRNRRSFRYLILNVSSILDQFSEVVSILFHGDIEGITVGRASFKNLISLVDEQFKPQSNIITPKEAKFQEIHKILVKEINTLDNTVIIQFIDIFYDENEGGNCSFCDINSEDEASTEKYLQKEGTETPVCKDCYDQIDYIGTRLPKTDYLIYGNREKNGGRITLFGDISLTLSESRPKKLKHIYHVEALTDSGMFSRIRIARHLPQITKEELKDEKWFNLFSQEEDSKYVEADRPKTFNMIAQKSKKEGKGGELVGRPLLGFFKADVDNLGLIFSIGLKDKLSVARLASASRMLNVFFSEYIVELAKKEFPDIYVVFAGGDDLFMIGPWNKTVQFAIKLREKLSLYCASNPDITLSGGVLIAKPRLPVRKAVELTEDRLELAKHFSDENRLKDSFCLLGEILSWQEAEELIKLGERFDKAIEEKERTGFSTAFLYRLLEYHNMYRKFTRENKIKFGRYLSLAHYDIARNILSSKNPNQEELEMLYEIFVVGVSERPVLDRLNIPLFYAINSNRKD